MAKEPEDRFQTAGEVVELLTDWRPPERKLQRAVPLEGSEMPAGVGATLSPVGTASGSSSSDDDDDAMLVEIRGSFFHEHRRLLLFSGLGAADRKSTRLNSSNIPLTRMPSSA